METTNTPIVPVATNEGDYVRETQQMATDHDFRHVSKAWYQNTVSVDQVLADLVNTSHERTCAEVSLAKIEPVEVDGRFAIAVGDRAYYPDQHAVGQLGTILKIGSQYPKRLLSLASEQRGSVEALVVAIRHAKRASDQSRQFRLHVENGEQLRSFQPKWSFTVDNEWYMRFLSRELPGARLSHRRGDSYTILGNVLIPDSIRAEADSDYGAMVSVATSEIRAAKFRQRPSCFRAICCNGMIWGQTKGKEIAFSSNHARDRNALATLLKENITEQIAIAQTGLDTFLATRTFETDVAIKPIIAQVAAENHLTKPQASAVLAAWWVEHKEVPDYDRSLFSIVNAVTRAGQGLDAKTWLRFDELGGELAAMKRDCWGGLVARASKLSGEQVEKRYTPWSISI